MAAPIVPDDLEGLNTVMQGEAPSQEGGSSAYHILPSRYWSFFHLPFPRFGEMERVVARISAFSHLPVSPFFIATSYHRLEP